MIGGGGSEPSGEARRYYQLPIELIRIFTQTALLELIISMMAVHTLLAMGRNGGWLI